MSKTISLAHDVGLKFAAVLVTGFCLLRLFILFINPHQEKGTQFHKRSTI